MRATVVMTATILVVSSGAAWAFEVHESSGLRLDWNGAPLIVDDFLSEPNELADADGWEATTVPAGRAVNIYRSSSDWLNYRREVATSPDTCELAVRFRLHAYHEKDIEKVTYGFRVPVEALDGFEFKAHTNRPYRQKVVEGRLSGDTPDGTVAGGMAYLTLTGPSAALTLDFAHGGQGLVYNLRNYGIVGNGWTLTKAGEHLVFSLSLNVRWYGGLLTSKVVFLEGVHAYEDMHPVPDERHYGIGPLPTLGAAFYEPAPEKHISLGLDPFSSERGVGWVDAAGLELAPAVLGGMVTGPGGTLRCQTVPGHYLVTVRFGAAEAVGPFALTANGRRVGARLASAPGEVVSHTFPIRLNDGKLDLAFEGHDRFGVSAVLLQQLMSSHEDTFVLRRGLWQVRDIPTPDTYIDPGEPPAGEPPPIPANADWRWDMAMASLGPSNTGSCNELNTFADIERRMVELESSGFNTVICNGLHFRLCHLDTRPMQQRNMKMICDVAHRHGIRVIEHHDVPLMLAHNEGYQTLVDHVDWLQRGIATGRVSTYFCPANPEFQRWYYDWFERYAEATGIDGCMLDEVTFFGKNYCGCEHCRAKFTEETGLVLPYSDDGTVFYNKESALWVEWEKARIRGASDFFRGIREILDRANPAASILTYTTHYGFTSHYGSRGFGGDIVDRARYIDFLGTEIMSRNVFDSHRAVFALRKTKNALMHHFDSPVYGLVYHVDDPHIAYFGWALQHMNRQASWLGSIEGENMTRYIHWKDKMDTKTARALSDIALVFSRTCCNYNRKSSHVANQLGCSEVLSDAHIQHDVILDLDLTPEQLKPYRLVVLASVECLSAAQVEALRGYVKHGGSLLVLGWSSLCDTNGTILDDLQLADLAGVHLLGNVLRKPVRVLPEGGTAFEAQATVPRVTAVEGVAVLAQFIDKEGNAIAPAVTQRADGEGYCFYSSLPLGTLNYERELTIGDTYKFEPDVPSRDLFLDVVRRSTQAPLTFEPVAIPAGLLVTAYRVPGGYAVHLLNATGVDLKPGDTIPGEKTGDVFPAIEEPVVFDLLVPGIATGRAVSPDYDAARSVDVAREGWAFRVTVPPEAVQAYSIVYLEE